MNARLAESGGVPRDVVLEPQLTGLITAHDVQASLDDPETVTAVDVAGNTLAVLTPIRNNSEANHSFFTSDDAYFLNNDALERMDPATLDMAKIGSISLGTQIMVEHDLSDATPITALQTMFNQAGRTLQLDKRVLDDFNGTMAGVHHFYSPVTRTAEISRQFSSLRDAHAALQETDEWKAYEAQGLRFVNGQDITPELMERLWSVYDETFDVLVSNHPSAQKQPKDAFIEQCAQPFSNITYVAPDGEEICSALFMVDDTMYCNWLDQRYFDQKNPDGDTAFVPGVSTRIEKQGLKFSPLTMGAMSWLAMQVPNFTGFATQCTNRSVDYIPRLSQDATVGTTNLQFEPTATYQYPVYTVN